MTQNIVFIDSRVSNYQSFIADLSNQVEVFVLDSESDASVQGELDRVSQALTGRIKQLAERYATPIPKLKGEVVTLAARVDEHLKKMGFAWK